MSDVAGAAPAAAESAPAPVVDEHIVDVPNPVETVDTAPPEPKEPAKPPTIRESLDKHEKALLAKQEAEAKPAKTEAKAEPKAAPKEAAKAERIQDPATGKFVAKDKPAGEVAAKVEPETPAPAKSAHEAPKRFSEDAKKVWDTAPDPVKAEVSRMEREMTQGIEKHRAKAERDDTLTEFHDMAAQAGKDLKSVVSGYVAMENKIRGDLFGGLDAVVQQATEGKYSLRDVAAHVMGQKPEDVATQESATIRKLEHELNQLKQQVGGVSQTIQQQQQREQQQREDATVAKVTEWAKDKPLFDLLAPHIVTEMQAMEVPDLDEAHKAVLQKYPQLAALSSPAPKDAESPANVTDLAEQIRKGTKSPTGAPTPGSDPATKRTPSKTIRGSLDQAFARAGFG